MDAFEQRKARQEQRKYAKELNSNKVAEKSKRKKEGLEEIEQWKKGAKRSRSECVTRLRLWYDRVVFVAMASEFVVVHGQGVVLEVRSCNPAGRLCRIYARGLSRCWCW